ncbi:hypothetical protein PVAND_008038 [Polypedilum vanderplanki]|uniref:Uncharacterized protein n=1 Tax=Polypedilum vanderplanki TaxID=319348 RepID=A0A9J6C876_POLVA|nr:hypothetical protein PVAND_008038 [Polypedilum vanderplanki]
MKTMRGDLKWPPEHTRQQMLEELEEQKEIAAGPKFKPKKVKKDYTSFFDQHKLNASFPGYKPAPNTQFFRTANSNTQYNGSNDSNSE